MKNNIFGFGLSALLHVAVVAQLWMPDSKPTVEPKEKIVPLNMAMFQEPVKKVEPIIEPSPKVIEKPITKDIQVKKPLPIPEKVVEKAPVIKEVIPLPEPEKPLPKVIKKQDKPKELNKRKQIIKPQKKVLKKKPEKPLIKKKVIVKNSLEEDIEKLLNPKKHVVKKVSKPEVRKQPPIKRPVKRAVQAHQPRRQNRVVKKVAPKINHTRQVTKRPPRVAPRTNPVVPKRSLPQKQQATPNTTGFEAAYKSRLRKLIESMKKYPRRAKRRGDQGVVKVSFVISANGQVSQIQVIQSSGSRILDEAAKKTIQKVSGRIPFPKEIKRSQWKLTLPITYRFRR